MKIEAKLFSLTQETPNKLTTTTHEEHIKLYHGYVKNSNLVLEKIAQHSQSSAENSYELGELYRRFSFEYNGVNNHELYFEQISGGLHSIDTNSTLYSKIAQQWGSWDLWVTQFTLLAKTRGVGWAILYYDEERDLLLNSWVDEQHLGQLNGCRFIYGIDMWEHSYVHDYLPSGKPQYIEDYIASTNWKIVSNRIEKS